MLHCIGLHANAHDYDNNCDASNVAYGDGRCPKHSIRILFVKTMMLMNISEDHCDARTFQRRGTTATDLRGAWRFALYIKLFVCLFYCLFVLIAYLHGGVLVAATCFVCLLYLFICFLCCIFLFARRCVHCNNLFINYWGLLGNPKAP